MAEILTTQDIANEMLRIEPSVVASIYAEPSLLFEYELSKDLFKSPIWKCLFIIAERIISKGGHVLDQVTVETFLAMDGNEKLRTIYENMGGYAKVELPMEMVDVSNMSMWVDDLKKYSAVYDYVQSCTLTSEDLRKHVNALSSNELYDYVNAKVSNVFVNIDTNIGKPKSITHDIRTMISKCDEGLSVGLPIPSEILNSEIKGLQMGQIYGIAGLSGAGKTTTVIEFILSTIWENGESALMMLNEQDLAKMQQQILTWIINNKLSPKIRFSSGRWMDGHFTDEEKSLIEKATVMLEEKIDDNVILIEELQRYTCKSVCKLMRKYASLGVKYFILDTFKISADSGGGASWESFMMDAIELYDLVKPAGLNVNLVLTLQLEKGRAAISRYLNESNIGIGKNVKDVFSVLLLIRRLYNDEYTGEKFELKTGMPIAGTESTREVTLDKNKQYAIIFIDKNRNGVSNQYQIVAEQNLGWLIYKEVGICNVPYGT